MVATHPDRDETRAELASRLRQEIELSGGTIPFSRFMERALYEPVLGYYERAVIGRTGDFYTSVSAGPLFGELLAHQACLWWERFLPGATTLTWIEAGAHDGRFALDFLGWLHRERPGIAARVRYGIVEPSATRRAWQAETLAPHRSQVFWADAIPAFEGILFGNELLDAFPVERFLWDAAAGRWWRLGVGWEGERFVWRRLDPGGSGTAMMEAVPAELCAVLPTAYTVECSPGAEGWWRRAAGQLVRGALVTFDYGYEEGDRFRPGRMNGTLRGYRGHRLVEDVLADPGEVDLTAHVDFDRMRVIGEASGLRTFEYGTQGRVMTRWVAEMLSGGLGFEWTPVRLRQFQTLVHPQHLGQSFRVLAQARADTGGEAGTKDALCPAREGHTPQGQKPACDTGRPTA